MDLSGVSHILYTQDDCQTGNSQFSSYYYRVVGALLDAEKVGALTVAPLMPFAPCNNAVIEADPTTPSSSAILTRYSVDCRTFLDLSAAVVCDLDVFLENAAGKFRHTWAPNGTVFWLEKEKRTLSTIESDGAVSMVVDSTAPCAITGMPPAWGTGKPIMTVLSATNKYKFRLSTPPTWPHPGYEEFLDGSKKYLVVHWKRGSNLSAEHGQTADDHSIRTDPERVGESINYLISVNRKANPQSPADGIFIATDSATVADRDKVISTIRKEWKKIPIFMTPLLTTVSPADRWRYDWADLWVGSRGSAWFLGPYCAEDCSTFGRLMISNGRRFNDKLAVTFM